MIGAPVPYIDPEIQPPIFNPTKLPRGKHCEDCQGFPFCFTGAMRDGDETECYDNQFQPK